MKILIDETGIFNFKNPSDFGLVTLVTIPTGEEKPLLKLIKQTEKGYPKKIKGTNIRFADRVKIFTHLKNSPYIKYSTTVTCGSVHSEGSLSQFKKLQIEKLNKAIDLPRNIGNVSLVKDLELLRNQANNLAIGDFVKFIFISNLLIDWQRVFPYDYLNYPEDKETWKFKFIIHTLNKPEKMKRLVKSFLYLTTNNLNPSYNVFLPEEWLPKHKFIKKYDTKAGVNAKKIYKNLGFYTEEEKPLLKIPDLIGNSFLKTLNKPDNIAYTELLKMLKNNRSVWMTLKKVKNYFIVSGLDRSKANSIHFNIRQLYKNLNYSPII